MKIIKAVVMRKVKVIKIKNANGETVKVIKIMVIMKKLFLVLIQHLSYKASKFDIKRKEKKKISSSLTDNMAIYILHIYIFLYSLK